MAKLVICWLLIYSGIAHSQTYDLKIVRNIFFECGEHPCKKEIYNTFLFKDEPIYIAYKGILIAMSAQCHINIYKKYKVFSIGRDFMEEAVKVSPNNFEIRFLRFVFQNKIPAILGYNNKEEDKVFLLKNFSAFIKNEPDEMFKLKVIQTLNSLEGLDNNDRRYFLSFIN